MQLFNKRNRQMFLCLLASLVIGASPAMAKIILPTAIEFDKAISFQKPDGEPVQLTAGIYEVAMGSEKELKFDPIGAGAVITVQALPANHNEAIEVAKAFLTPSPDNNPDKPHVILWMPDGVALEAIGSYSGVFSRSTLTWGTAEEGEEAAGQDPLIVSLEKAVYFKTAGGDPKILKPGDYEVGVADDGIVLTPVGGKPDNAITIEPESLGTSAAVVLPELDGNPNLKLLVLATVGGQSLIAVGSEDGTFPRGWRSWAKKKAKGAVNRAKRTAKKGYRASYGKAKKYGKKYARKATSAARKHGVRYARKMGRAGYRAGKRYVTKFCGSKSAQAAAAAAAASTGVGTVGSGAIAGGCLVVNKLK
jgi:hypothetical protein